MEAKNRKNLGPLDTHIGARIRFRRSLIGISQAKLAECIGITFQQLQKYERGINRVSASRLYQISKALGVSIQYFYLDDTYSYYEDENVTYINIEKVNKGLSDEAFIDKDARKILEYYYNIKDQNIRKSFLSLLKTVSINQ